VFAELLSTPEVGRSDDFFALGGDSILSMQVVARARAARQRLTSDFDWKTVAAKTAQVYLAAKRAERQPHARLPIVEHALPNR